MGESTHPDSVIDRFARWVQDHALLVGGGAVVALVAAVAMGIALAAGGPPPDGELPPATTATDTSAPSTDPASPPVSGESPVGTGTTLPPGAAASLIGVKIDNAGPARPQIGLDDARLVVEAPVEGGITRFLAFFPPGDTLVGPVRSARSVDVDLVGLLSDTLVSTGGRPFVLGELAGHGFTLIGHDPLDNPFQTLERPSPHNQFISLSGVAPPGDIESGFPSGDLPPSNETTEVLEIPYATPATWTYRNGAYSRADGGEPAIVLPEFDSQPQPFVVDTVVVMAVNERSAGYTDVNEVEVTTFDVIGSERLWVYHQGNRIEGTWFRASHADGYLFRTLDGTDFGLPPGRTFVHLVPRHLLEG